MALKKKFLAPQEKVEMTPLVIWHCATEINSIQLHDSFLTTKLEKLTDQYHDLNIPDGGGTVMVVVGGVVVVVVVVVVLVGVVAAVVAVDEIIKFTLQFHYFNPY